MSLKTKILFALMLVGSGIFLYQGFTLLYQEQGINENNSSLILESINK